MQKRLVLKLMTLGILLSILGGLSYMEYRNYQDKVKDDDQRLNSEGEIVSFRNVKVKEDMLKSLTNMCKSAGRDHVELKIRYGYLTDEEESQLMIEGEEFDTGMQVDFYSKIEGRNELMWQWLEENAHKYGFILRYPEGKEALTGHTANRSTYRYVGVNVATTMKEQNLCLEEL